MGTRPTTDRVREAWASTLSCLAPHGRVSGLSVLDAFAGSGALGLELLSRGARSCLFLENNSKAFAALKANIAALGYGSREASCKMVDCLAPQLLNTQMCESPFDLIVLDPPYALSQERIGEFLGNLARAGLLSTQSVISYEHAHTVSSVSDFGKTEAKDDTLDNLTLGKERNPLRLKLVKSKKYGTIQIDYYMVLKVHELDSEPQQRRSNDKGINTRNLRPRNPRTH